MMTGQEQLRLTGKGTLQAFGAQESCAHLPTLSHFLMSFLAASQGRGGEGDSHRCGHSHFPRNPPGSYLHPSRTLPQRSRDVMASRGARSWAVRIHGPACREVARWPAPGGVVQASWKSSAPSEGQFSSEGAGGGPVSHPFATPSTAAVRSAPVSHFPLVPSSEGKRGFICCLHSKYLQYIYPR